MAVLAYHRKIPMNPAAKMVPKKAAAIIRPMDNFFIAVL